MTHPSKFLKKYNVPGPRYTSYPTVPYWDLAPTESQWLEGISASLDEGMSNGIGAAVYIHIPFCEALCTYCGCNTRITKNHKLGNPYIHSVLKEWDLYVNRVGRKIELSEIHLGGGTPTFLAPLELETLVEGILSRSQIFSSSDSSNSSSISISPEFSVEADPRVTQREHLVTLYRLGFRRLSLGVQDFDPAVQAIVHRVQSEEQVRELTEMAREIGFTGINYDLIYGLPLQTPESIQATVQAVQRLRPDRIAFYSYAHVPWIRPGQRRFTETDLPNGDEKRILYELGRTMLEEVGYCEVGIDHFALKTDSLWKASEEKTLHRNFMGYISRQVSPLIGLGVSAIGDSWTAFAQNEKLLETYQARVEANEIPIARGHILSQEDRILRKHILNLMTQLATEWTADVLDAPHLVTIHPRLAEMVNDGLVELKSNSCRITDEGRPFIRNVCMAFDARLALRAPTTPIFSRTI